VPLITNGYGRLSNTTMGRRKTKLKPRRNKNPASEDGQPAKRWNPIFSTNRKGRDRPFIETFEELNEKRKLLDMLPRDSEISGQSWEVEQTRKYLCEATNLSQGQVWVDLRVKLVKSNTGFSGWLDSSELPSKLTQDVRFLFNVCS
jgi:hypothetical protein